MPVKKDTNNKQHSNQGQVQIGVETKAERGLSDLSLTIKLHSDSPLVDLYDLGFQAGVDFADGLGNKAPDPPAILEAFKEDQAALDLVRKMKDAIQIDGEDTPRSLYDRLSAREYSMCRVEQMVDAKGDLRFENAVVSYPRFTGDRLEDATAVMISLAEGGTIGGWPAFGVGAGYYRAQLQRLFWHFFDSPSDWSKVSGKVPVRVIVSGPEGLSSKVHGLVKHRGAVESFSETKRGVCVWPEEQLRHLVDLEDALHALLKES